MEENKKEIRFEKLTPTDNVDLRVYEPAIDFAFEEDINNIAITGAYGVGKSSVLESYAKKHSEYSFLHISMTNFEEEEDKDRVVTKIEGNILNQLIHQISPNVIDQTRFRRKEKLCKEKMIRDLWIPFVTILLLAIFIYSKYWYSDKTAIDIESINILFLFASSSLGTLMLYTLIVIMMLLIIYKVYVLQVNKNILKKIKIQGNEIELFQRDNDEYFNRYLNEIIFMITYSKVDIFVFEDIDRFNDKAIIVFEKLREINRIVNIKNRGNKKIVFLYLVRDDLLTAAERTKFFDYIIPVVPVVSGNSSYDKILEMITKDIDVEIDNRFLRRATWFITDMRMLKNISNEFKIYYLSLGKLNLKFNKTMAMIMYKNLFPEDFSKLRKNQGVVYYLLKEIKDRYAHFDIDDVFNQNNLDVIEKSEYLGLIKFLLKEKYIDQDYQAYLSLFNENSMAFSDKRFLMGLATGEYLGSDYSLNDPERILLELEKEDFIKKEVCNLDLIKYMFKENKWDVYLETLVHNHESSLDYKFINEFLNQNEFINEFSNLISIFWTDLLRKLVLQYLDSNKREGRVISEENINKISLSLINKCKLGDYIERDSLGELKIDLNNAKTRKQIEAIIFTEHKTYISNQRKYFIINDINISNVIHNLATLGVKFKYIYDYVKEDIIFNHIYEACLYECNFENVKLILKKEYKIDDDNELEHRNYTNIMKNRNSALACYIQTGDTINIYISDLLEKCKNHTDDTAECVIEILNNEMLEFKYKEKYIESIKKEVISNINSITNKSLWKAIYRNRVVVADPNNIINYYNYCKKVDDILIKTINESSCKLEFSKNLDIDSKIIESFMNDAMQCCQLSNTKYQYIYKYSSYKIEKFKSGKIDKDKIQILVEENAIKMTELNLVTMRTYYEDKKYLFIKKNLDQYLDITTVSNKSHEEIKEILGWYIDKEIKFKLLEYLKRTISVKPYIGFPDLTLRILEEKFDINDLEFLLEMYDDFANEIQLKIYDIASKNIYAVINIKNTSATVVRKLIQDQEIDELSKIKLMATVVDDEVLAKELFEFMGLKKFNKLYSNNCRCTFRVEEKNKLLLQAFKEAGLIADFEQKLYKYGHAYRILK